ncbi:hypothetical protein A2154_03975 [Candidatus Gottesmanbacteria bacterium RBG_16_43_7]|uniref:Polymerase beta nucleotidyltransferase domain-containing protein n=1 Tax=Candidatus Gottesmanbacteria bacterium RBG_16_43_7 TaxID=1798373 RepID=A0A1F5Z8I1_9BACT|nr:MAG: hypothetical protein A2154_03975 [Candidatus Gottesmanbacteria bacterium RBG_16_43_7]
MTFLAFLDSVMGLKIISFLVAHENESYYLRELARILNLDPSNLSKYLKIAEAEKIINSSRKGNLLTVQINTNHPLYLEIKKIVLNTSGIEFQLKQTLCKLIIVKSAFIYGSWAAGKSTSVSDIDLFIVGNIDENKLLSEITAIEQKIHREINYTLMDEPEFNIKKRSDSFVMNILKQPIITLI